MSKLGDDNRRSADQGSGNTPTRSLAIIALSALANYKEFGLVGPREGMHGQLVKRMARVAAEG